MSDLNLATFENDPLIFHLTDYPKAKRGRPDRYTFIMEAKTPKIKYTWTATIERRLWDQLNRAKGKYFTEE